jgi:integrase
MPKEETWDKRLKRSLKDEHGFGLRLAAAGEKTKFGLRATDDGSGTFVVLPFKYAPSNAQAISAAINHLLATMQEQGVTLKEAHRRCFPSGIVSPEKKQALIRGIDHVEWESIAQDFLDERQSNRSTTRRDTEGRIQRVLKTLRSKPAPRDGASLMKSYAEQHFATTPTGGQGRKRALGDVAALLRFAVQKRGAPALWMPLEGKEREALVGDSDLATEDLTVPIKPDQLAALLDALEADGRHQLRLAVALVGLFGLRPAELAVLKVDGGDLRVGSGVKRNPRTKNKKKKDRLVLELDIEGREGEGSAASQLYASGLVKLPDAIRMQIGKCLGSDGEVLDSLKPVGDAFRQQLERFPFWQSLVAATNGLTPYSLRHGFAWRAHMCGDRPMGRREAAAFMGHSVKTHDKHYGSWIDEDGLREAQRRHQRGGVINCQQQITR